MYICLFYSEGEVEVSNTAIPSTSMLFRAVDKRIPPVRILVSTLRRAELTTNRLLVSVDNWPLDSPVPVGHLVKCLGVMGDKSVENAVLLHEFGVENEAFSASVMNCLPPLGWKISEDVVNQRTDLRHLPVVSVDPPGCKDIDDALHCIELPNGNLEIGVHIADVTFFVHPDTPLDKEAARRSTSTYLVERRLDMLPGLLTTQLCSLRCNEDHLAFSVLWEMDRNANIIDVRYCKSVIHSVGSLSYADAQLMMDNPDGSNVVNKSVRLLVFLMCMCVG
jgi:exosome complex exonuclease DIS3/RRP44